MDGVAAQNQGWFAYSVVIVVAGFAVLVPVVVGQVFRLFSKTKRAEKLEETPQGRALQAEDLNVSRGSIINTRYFTAVQVGVLLTLPLILLIPLAIPLNGRGLSSVSLITLCLTAGVALIYSNRKGDLRWISSTQPDNQQASSNTRRVSS